MVMWHSAVSLFPVFYPSVILNSYVEITLGSHGLDGLEAHRVALR